MMRLAASTLRFRAGGFVASFLVLSLGTAIVMACGGLMETGIRLAVPPQRLTTPIVVTGDLAYPERVGLDAALVQRVRAVPGVATAAGVRDVGRRPGDAGRGEADRGEARRIDARRIDAIGVTPAADADADAVAGQIDAALRRSNATALTGDERGLAEVPEAAAAGETLIVVAAVFGGLAVMVAVFIVSSTLGLSIQLRQREMALLRAVGATPWQVRRMILAETLLVWALALAVALLPGRQLGGWLLERIAANGVVPQAIAFRQGWVPAVAAAGISLLTAVVAALVAARGAATTRPAEALAQATLGQRRLGWMRLASAVVLLGGGVALGIVTMSVLSGPVAASTAGPSAMLWAAGLAVLAPGITTAVAWVARWPVRAMSGVAGRVAMDNAHLRSIRMAGIVTPIMLVTGLATALIYLQTAQVQASQRAYAEQLRADAVLTSSTGGLPVDLADTVRRLPGVADAAAVVMSTGYLDNDDEDPQDLDVSLLGISPHDGAQALAAPVAAGTLADLRGRTVALSAEHAQGLDRGIGDTVPMRLGDGTDVELRLVALLSTPPGFEVAVVPAGLLVDHTTTGLASQVLVRGAPGTDQDRLTATLRQLGTRHAGLQVADRATAVAANLRDQQTGVWVNYLLVAVIVGYAAISLVNTLVVATGERRRELALQRLIGFTRGQVLRMMGVEAAFVATAGILLGAVVAAATLVPFSMALTGSLLPHGSPLIYLAIITAATVLTLVTALLVTARTLRVRPADAMHAPT